MKKAGQKNNNKTTTDNQSGFLIHKNNPNIAISSIRLSAGTSVFRAISDDNPKSEHKFTSLGSDKNFVAKFFNGIVQDKTNSNNKLIKTNSSFRLYISDIITYFNQIRDELNISSDFQREEILKIITKKQEQINNEFTVNSFIELKLTFNYYDEVRCRITIVDAKHKFLNPFEYLLNRTHGSRTWFRFEKIAKDVYKLHPILLSEKDLNSYEKPIYEGELTSEQETQLPKLQISSETPTIEAEKPLPDLPYQQIIFGTPGTGKSYYLEQQIKKLQEEYGNDNVTYKRVTFHPDYSYANFVGCYKPVMKSASTQPNVNLETVELLTR